MPGAQEKLEPYEIKASYPFDQIGKIHSNGSCRQSWRLWSIQDCFQAGNLWRTAPKYNNSPADQTFHLVFTIVDRVGYSTMKQGRCEDYTVPDSAREVRRIIPRVIERLELPLGDIVVQITGDIGRSWCSLRWSESCRWCNRESRRLSGVGRRRIRRKRSDGRVNRWRVGRVDSGRFLRWVNRGWCNWTGELATGNVKPFEIIFPVRVKSEE